MHQFTRKTVRKAAGALLLLVLVMVFSGCSLQRKSPSSASAGYAASGISSAVTY